MRNAEAVVGLYFPHHWYIPAPDTFGPRSDEGFDEVARQLKEYLAGGRGVRPAAPSPRQRAAAARVGSGSGGAYGQTISYGDLTRRLNCDVTPQQVGVDISRNPLCIFDPVPPRGRQQRKVERLRRWS